VKGEWKKSFEKGHARWRSKRKQVIKDIGEHKTFSRNQSKERPTTISELYILINVRIDWEKRKA